MSPKAAFSRSEAMFGLFDLNAFLIREKNGEFPNGGGDVDSPATDVLTNNNSGGTGTSLFTHAPNPLLAFGNTVILGFNDSGSNAGGSEQIHRLFSRSMMVERPSQTVVRCRLMRTGIQATPCLARNDTTGRIYFFHNCNGAVTACAIFRSDDNGVTWLAPVQGAPGKTGFQDKQWLAVDNFAGAGNGNVYHIARDFGRWRRHLPVPLDRQWRHVWPQRGNADCFWFREQRPRRLSPLARITRCTPSILTETARPSGS